MRIVFLVIACVVALNPGRILASPAEAPLKILVGGPAVVRIFEEKKSEYEKAAETKIQISVTPSDSAVVPFLKGLVDGLVIATSVDGVIKLGEKRGAPKVSPDEILTAEFTRVAVRGVVNPSNPVKALSRAQLKGILDGSITSWESITGEKRPLKLYLAKSYVFNTKALESTYLDGAECKAAQFVMDKDGALRVLQQDPGAIVFISELTETPSFAPKYIDTDASYANYLMVKRGGRSGAISLLEKIKSDKTIQKK